MAEKIKKRAVFTFFNEEERPLIAINDSFKKIIVVGNHIKLKRDENGIATMGIRQFLIDQNSLEL